jgi:CRP-like cAMP-binding protein
MAMWTGVRRRVLTGELSRRAGCWQYGINWRTLAKMLAHVEPPGYQRKANVVAEGDVECAVFELQDFNRLLETHPQLHTKILRNIGVSLATKLRKVNEDMRILIAERE